MPKACRIFFRLCNKDRQLLEERNDKGSLKELAKTPEQ